MPSFAFVAHPDAIPAKCIRCPRNENVIDLGAGPLRGYGIAYLCQVCFGELCTLIGMVDPRTHANAVASLQRRAAEAEEQMIELAAAQPAQPQYLPKHERRALLDGFGILLDRLADPRDPAGRDAAVPVPLSDEAPRRELGAADAAAIADALYRDADARAASAGEPRSADGLGDGSAAADSAGAGPLADGNDAADGVELPVGNVWDFIASPIDTESAE